MNRQRVLHNPFSFVSSRKKEKREKLRSELLVFAAKVRSEISSGRDSAFHRELSTEFGRMGVSELKKFKGKIRKGEEDGLFPVSTIMKKEGATAGHIAEFLGTRYVDFMVGLARSGGDIDNVKAGKEYLAWAAEHGNSGVKTRALAGIAKIAADELLEGNGNFLERELIRKRGILAALSREIGENDAWKIARGVLRIEKAASGIRMGISFLGGAFTASSLLAFQGGASATESLLIMASSGIVGVVAGLVFLANTNMEMLQGKIAGLLMKKNGHN